MRNKFITDIDNMEEIMQRTANRCDIWQDRCIYAIAKAVYDLLLFIVREADRRAL